MNDFIGVHYGGCGSRIGLQFWKKLRQQHELDTDNNDKKGYLSFFRQKEDGSYLNRAVFLDTDPQLKQLMQPYKNNFSADSIITENSSCRNIFAEGANGLGAQIRTEAVQKLRKQIQINDRKLDLMHTLSVSGGAGSGMINYTVGCFRECFPDTMHQYIQVIPDINGNFSSLQVYNAILHNNLAMEQPDLVVILQNKAVTTRLFRKKNIHPTIGQVNDQITDCMMEMTAPFRYSGPLNTNMRKIATNLLPFPRLKFLSPITSFESQKNYISSAIDPKNSFINKAIVNQKKIMSVSFNVRGDPFTSEAQINSQIRNKLKSQFCEFVYWIPNNLQVSITSESNKTKKPSASSLINSQQNVQWLRKLKDEFGKLFRRKAFLHYYLGIGMDQMQFTQSQSYTEDLISSYFPWSPEQSEDSEYDQYQ